MRDTVAFAGLVYLALWLCAKLGIAIPFAGPRDQDLVSATKEQTVPLRTQAAAPPTYLIVFPLIPIGSAIYISSTRYSDFWHHGFDVLASAVLGLLTAWLGFRWYHMPIRNGGGWAWAPRSSKRAYWKSMGMLTYGDSGDSKATDLEHGRVVGGQSIPPPGSQSARLDTSNGSGGSYEMNDFAAAAQAPTDFTAYERGQPNRRPRA